MNTPSNSPVISEKKCLDKYVADRMSSLGLNVKSQLDIWNLYKENNCLNGFIISHKYYD